MVKPLRGVLLVAHGSVVEGAEGDLLQVAAFVRQASGVEVVEVGYVSRTVPSIAEAVASCAKQGVTELLAMPYFLSAGYLQRKALRQVLAEAERYPQLHVQTGEPLGPHPGLADIVAARIAEALAERRPR